MAWMAGQRSRGLAVSLAGLVAVVFAAALDADQGGASGVRQGGTFRVAVAASELQSIDPALSYGPGSFASWLTAACELPVAFAPEKRSMSVRLVPQAAVALPAVSRDRTTYTFTIRRGLRFASGAPLTAQSYVDAINRALNATMHPDDAEAIAAEPWPGEVVGARAVLRGKAATVSGVRARGRKLVFKLERPDASFAAKITDPAFLCPVPRNLPVDAEGVGAPFSGGGPYYIATWERGDKVVFARNRFYRGTRPQHVDRFVLTVAGAPETTLHDIDTGKLDWAEALPLSVPELARRYGVNRSQFFVYPGGSVHYLALNTSRPLFRNNARLPRPINLAIDRGGVIRAYGPYSGRTTDQYLPSIIPGYRNANIYPLKRPDLRKARALAHGHTPVARRSSTPATTRSARRWRRSFGTTYRRSGSPSRSRRSSRRSRWTRSARAASRSTSASSASRAASIRPATSTRSTDARSRRRTTTTSRTSTRRATTACSRLQRRCRSGDAATPPSAASTSTWPRTPHRASRWSNANGPRCSRNAPAASPSSPASLISLLSV